MMNTPEFDNFKRCTEEAPRGTYEAAKALRTVIGDSADALMANIRELGLKADNCDLIYQVEASIYDYVKRSNPDNPMFAAAEAIGANVAVLKVAGIRENCTPIR